MVHSISNINLNQKYRIQENKNNNKTISYLNNIESDSINFKGKQNLVKNTTPKIKQTLKTILAGVAGYFGLKVLTEEEKSIKKENLALQEKLDLYAEKYPELMTQLNEVEKNEGTDSAIHIYTPQAKVVIVETFEKNPKLAYELSQKLKYDNSPELNDNTIDTIINDYDNVLKYKGKNLFDSVQKYEIVKQNPKMEEIASYRGKYENAVTASDLALYSEYCTTDEATEALSKVLKSQLKNLSPWLYKAPIENMKIASFSKKYPNLDKRIFKLINSTGLTDSVKQAVELYIDVPDKLLNYVEIYGFEDAVELLPYFDNAPKHFNLATKVKSNSKDIQDYTEKVIMTEELFKDIKAVNPEMSDAKLLEDVLYKCAHNFNKCHIYADLRRFIENMTIKNKTLYIRMIEDLRCNSIKEMESLLPIYQKYAGTEITDEMIKNYNDPMKRAMGLF